MSVWLTGRVISIQHWTSNLFTIIINAPVDTFIPGQFTRLCGIVNGKRIQRAYSYVNSPNNTNLEFYITYIKTGKLSPWLRTLNPGDKIMISKKSSGEFILDCVPDCHSLWMLSTSTGISPYLSILQHGEGLRRFTNIVLVHATRFKKNLNYISKIVELKKLYKNKIRIQIIFSQETQSNVLTGRLPALIDNGLLEDSVGLKINPDDSHIMLCGNPRMIYEVQNILRIKYDMYNDFKKNIKYITKEQYWQHK